MAGPFMALSCTVTCDSEVAMKWRPAADGGCGQLLVVTGVARVAADVGCWWLVAYLHNLSRSHDFILFSLHYNVKKAK